MERNLSVEFRPQTLDEFIGCEKITNAIKEGVRQGRVDSTYLFVGPPGSGKTSIARATLRFLNGYPEDCDIVEPDTGDLGADQIRELIAHSRINPWTGPYKGIILDEAHKISAASQTILLKALEEPCPSTVWAVSTSEPGKLNEAWKRRGSFYIMPTLGPDTLKALVLSTIKRVGGEVDMKYLQTPGPNKQALAYDLADALVKNEISSPGLIVRAVEKLITGISPEEAARVSEVTEIDTFGIAVATAKGDWSTIQRLLKGAPLSAAKDLRRVVAGYFRSILMKEPLGSARALRCVWAIEQMAELANQNQFEDGLIMSATCAAIYKICTGQKDYIAKKV